MYYSLCLCFCVSVVLINCVCLCVSLCACLGGVLANPGNWEGSHVDSRPAFFMRRQYVFNGEREIKIKYF